MLGELSDTQKQAVIVYFTFLRYDFKSWGNTTNPQLGQLGAIYDYKKVLHEGKPSLLALRKSNWLQRIKQIIRQTRIL